VSGETPQAHPAPGSLQITVNNEAHVVPAGINIRALLAHLGIRADRVAIERNLQILPRDRWEATQVAANDRYEIVHFVGGG
jgi:sulfur carrier protein